MIMPAIGLAVLGATCFACAAVLQHRAVGSVTGGDRLVARALPTLVSRPRWLAGFGFGATGTALHAVALVLAPLSVVQPVGVLAVPITVLVAGRGTGRGPVRGVLVGVGLAVTGVVAFVALAAGNAVDATPVPSAVPIAVGCATLAVGIGSVVAVVGSGWVRNVAFATAGAVAFGLVSALVRALSQEIGAGVSPVAPGSLATVLALLVALITGGWLVQLAFAAGPPEVVVACLTVIDPVVAVLLGVLLLGEGAGTSVVASGLLGLAAGAAAVGVLTLARHHPDAVRRHPAPSPPEPRPVVPERSP